MYSLSRLSLRTARVLAPVLLAVTLALPVDAEDATPKEQIQVIAQQQNAIRQTYKLERAGEEIMYLETLALLAGYGGWSRYGATDAASMGTKRIEYLKLKEMVGAKESDLVHAMSAVERNKSVSEDELKRFSDIYHNVEALSAVAIEVHDLLEDDKIDEANALYRDKSIPLISSINADSYTLISSLEEKIDKAALHARLAQ